MMTPPSTSEPPPPVNVYLFYATHLELTNFEEFISANNITITSATTNSLGLRTFGPFAHSMFFSI
jgi:hypothetical protein